jgi:hypothetical protein
MTNHHAPTQTHRHPGLALAIICVAQLMIVLDATVILKTLHVMIFGKGR